MKLTDKQILEGNKLIAEFMDWYIVPYCPSGDVWNHENIQDSYNLNQFRFNSSWDWLMPVVEKIESLPVTDKGCICVSIVDNCCDIFFSDWGGHDTISMDISKDGKLDATFKAILKFIEWYNNNK